MTLRSPGVKLRKREHAVQLLNVLESRFAAQACDVRIVSELVAVVEARINRLFEPFQPERSIAFERIGAREVVHGRRAVRAQMLHRLGQCCGSAFEIAKTKQP